MRFAGGLSSFAPSAADGRVVLADGPASEAGLVAGQVDSAGEALAGEAAAGVEAANAGC